MLMRDLDNIKSSQDAKLYEKFGTDFDIVSPKVFDDTVTVSIEKVKVSYYPTEKMLKKQNKKRLNRYTKKNLVKNKGKQYAHISIPIISYDGEKAIVYGGYYCGGLCGSGGIFFLEKIDGMWHLIEYERRWVA